MNSAKIWGLRVVMALTTFAFVMAGTCKLMGNEMMHASFLAMGLPVWFGYFIGACEIAGGIGIWFRKLSSWAGAGLAIIMIGATYYHLVYQQPGVGAAIMLGVFGTLIAVLRRKDALFLSSTSSAQSS